jgi:hypothetical protein
MKSSQKRQIPISQDIVLPYRTNFNDSWTTINFEKRLTAGNEKKFITTILLACFLFLKVKKDFSVCEYL